MQIVLGGDVRHFAMHLPRVLTDRERLVELAKSSNADRTPRDDSIRDRTLDRSR